MFWRGVIGVDESDQRVFFSVFQGGTGADAWSPQQVMQTPAQVLASSSRPGVAAFDNQLFLATVGNVLQVTIDNPDPGEPGDDFPPDSRIFYTTFDGANPDVQIPIPHRGTSLQPALCTFQNDRYAAIWEQRGGPAFQARHRLTSVQYQQTFDALGSQGFRLIYVSGYNVDGVDRYAAIWEQRDGPPLQARHGLTSAQYQQTFDTLGSQGFRLVHVSGYPINGEHRFAAIWEQRAGPAFQARHDLTAEQYQAAFDDLVRQGFRLVRVSGY
jgi:hypothetical protein